MGSVTKVPGGETGLAQSWIEPSPARLVASGVSSPAADDPVKRAAPEPPDDLLAWRAALSPLSDQIQAARSRNQAAHPALRHDNKTAAEKAPSSVVRPQPEGESPDKGEGNESPAAPLADAEDESEPENLGPTPPDAARAFTYAQAQFRQRQTQEAAAREAFRSAYASTAKQPRPAGRFASTIASRLGAAARRRLIQASGVFRANDRLAPWSTAEPYGDHPLFDRTYYLASNPDVARGKTDPFLHYLRFGDAEGRDPSPLFRVQWYRQGAGCALDRWGATTLSHYVQLGAAGGLSAHPLFDPLYYASQCPPGLLAGCEPMSHYLIEGWRLGLDPHPLFSSGFYLGCNPDVAALGIPPWRHYVTDGWRELRQPHPLFDVAFYLQRWPEVAAEGVEPLEHFVTTGWKEGRDPHPEFFLHRYLERNADVAASGENPLVHYCESGGWEGRDIGCDFDPGLYLAARASSTPSRLPPFALWIWDGRPAVRHVRAPKKAKPPPEPKPSLTAPQLSDEERQACALRDAFQRLQQAQSFRIEPLEGARRASALRQRLLDERRERLAGLATARAATASLTPKEVDALKGALRFPVTDTPTLTVIVVGGALSTLARTLAGLSSKVAAKTWQVLVADTERELGLAPWCQTQNGLQLAVSNMDGPIAAIDAAMRQARADVVVVLGEGVSLASDDIAALDRLSDLTSHSEWATPLVVGGDGRVLEAGSCLDRSGNLVGLGEGEDPSLPFIRESRHVVALSGRCFACRSANWRATYDALIALYPSPSFSDLSRAITNAGDSILYSGRELFLAAENAPTDRTLVARRLEMTEPALVAAAYSLSARSEALGSFRVHSTIPNVACVRFPRVPAAPKSDEAALAPLDLAVKRAQTFGVDAFLLDADELFAAPEAATKALNRLDKLGQGYLLRLSLADPRLGDQAQLLQKALNGKQAVRFGERPLLLVADIDKLDKPRRGLRALRLALQALDIPNPWCIAEDPTGQHATGEDASVFGADAWTAPSLRASQGLPPSRAEVLNPDFAGEAYDYADAIAATVAAWPHQRQFVPWVFASHDTTLFEGVTATVVTEAYPAGLQVFLEAALQFSQHAWPPQHRLVLLSSFNNWYLGSAIEPDEAYGESWLDAVALALEGADETLSP